MRAGLREIEWRERGKRLGRDRERETAVLSLEPRGGREIGGGRERVRGASNK
jgi:hypothetical protein